ncbi:hypothetical protein GUJ93_ZPchr0006g45821 [Zizania palustris]|uniref:Uncharacterized protein n=1 Tax=Zizania palustris TaxID=103762 RepID=A0A8J5T7G1_ZIZPA|nr:hypothetical protein GUJ93_ZPchr0006g45821 [Zizania palustris]
MWSSSPRQVTGISPARPLPPRLRARSASPRQAIISPGIGGTILSTPPQVVVSPLGRRRLPYKMSSPLLIFAPANVAPHGRPLPTPPRVIVSPPGHRRLPYKMSSPHLIFAPASIAPHGRPLLTPPWAVVSPAAGYVSLAVLVDPAFSVVEACV